MTEGRDRVHSDHWIVKIGSGVLVTEDGDVDHNALHAIVKDLKSLRERGVTITIVSSGAVAIGRIILGDRSASPSLPKLQALAATGQAKLIQMYDEAFGETDVAQILLTRADLNDRRRFMNARQTLEELHRANVIPIVNENDTVATEELRFGDNDELAAMTAYIDTPGLLVILSVAPGFCRLNEDGSLGDVISNARLDDDALDTMISSKRSATGKGGMRTKLAAARLASTMNVPTVVAPGKRVGVLDEIRRGENVGTYFDILGAEESWVNHQRKSWITLNDTLEGTLVCDAGARRAIEGKGASLLPSGVVSVTGSFLDGALIGLEDESGERFAKGVAVYGSEDIRKIAGRQSSEIAELLGYYIRNNVVHRDGLVLLTRS